MTAVSTRYRFEGPLAVVEDPGFFREWIDDDAFVEKLVASDSPGDAKAKRVAVEFQRGLARMVASGRVADTVDEILARFLSDDYRQHDAHLSDGRESLADFFQGAEAAGIDLWPPMPVCVLADRGVVTLLLQALDPNGGERFIPTMFRVDDGRLVEHWSAAAPPTVHD